MSPLGPLIHATRISPGVLPLFALVLTVGAYLLGVAVQRRVRSPVANPVLIAVIFVKGFRTNLGAVRGEG